jgi:hypothetical protein
VFPRLFRRPKPALTLAIGFKFSHHNDDAGYDELRFYLLPTIDYLDLSWIFRLRHHPRSVPRRALGALCVFFADVYVLLIARRYDVVHFLYVENFPVFSGWLLSKLGIAKVVYSHHLDPEHCPVGLMTSKSLWHETLLSASAHVCLTLDQARRLQASQPGLESVTCIPHGMHAFPAPKRQDVLERFHSDYVVIAGSNYRDFSLIRGFATQLGALGLRLEIVGGGEWKGAEGGLPSNMVVHGRLDYDDYNLVFQRAFALCLPLTYASANNALLESFAIGLPCVISEKATEGIDYILPELRVGHTAEGFASRVHAMKALSKDAYYQLAVNHWALGREKCGWPLISSELLKLYGNLSKQRAEELAVA